MKKLLRLIKRAADKIFVTKADEFFWRYRHIFHDKNWAEIKNPINGNVSEVASDDIPNFEKIIENQTTVYRRFDGNVLVRIFQIERVEIRRNVRLRSLAGTDRRSLKKHERPRQQNGILTVRQSQ